MKKNVKVLVPLDVPKTKREEYMKNYSKLTHNTGRLMLFAGDQRVEHLNDDFYGKGIPKDDAKAEHLFKVASKAKIGAFATQLGLIARFPEYADVPTIVKINSKTNLVKTEQEDPLSTKLWDIEQVMKLKKAGANILGIGYTIYLGSEYEHFMLREAAQLIFEAHQNGLITILWIYPRGKAVKNEHDSHLIAGAANVANALNADFVKLSYPENALKAKSDKELEKILTEITNAGGNTKVVFAGGPKTSKKEFLTRLYKQIHLGNAGGSATGRNIHQNTDADAVKMCNAIFSIVVENKKVEDALKILKR